MKPNLGQLSDGQRTFWSKLVATPDDFSLFGGIAISLYFGHRPSTHFDFFCRQNFDPEELLRTVSYLNGAEVLDIAPNTLVCRVKGDEPVEIGFFGLPDFGVVAAAEVVEELGIKISPVLELAGSKLSILQKRAAARDYLDLDRLLTEGGVDLTEALLAGRQLYGARFHPKMCLNALTFFEGGNLSTLPSEVRQRLVEAKAGVDAEKLAEKIRETE